MNDDEFIAMVLAQKKRLVEEAKKELGPSDDGQMCAAFCLIWLHAAVELFCSEFERRDKEVILQRLLLAFNIITRPGDYK